MKIAFLPNPRSRSRDLARLIEPVEYLPLLDPARMIQIPADYVTDFASVPDILVWFIHPNSKKVRMAALAHDYIWDHRVFFQKQWNMTGKALKKWSNKEFERACISLGTDRLRARIMYLVLQYSAKADQWFWDEANNFKRLGLR
jgi:hypothetical protein